MNFEYSNYVVRLLDKNNILELQEVQRLRYDYLLCDFNPSLTPGGIDDDGYDMYADSIIVIDNTINKIVGTYRVATKKTVGLHPFIDEEEFNIDTLKQTNEELLELGRAVIHKEYRNGVVFQLLWAGIYEYAIANKCKYLFGTISLHGTTPIDYKNLLCYLNKELIFEKDVYATHNAFEYNYIDEYNEELVKKEIPNLLKAYIAMGVRMSKNGFIDYDFNSSDVLGIADLEESNGRFLTRVKRIIGKMLK